MATSTGGLQISPIRQELKADPGTTTNGELVVANLTGSDLDISLFFRDFTVTNATYDYTFDISRYDWIRISQPELTLKPGESRTVTYTLTPDKGASPGGYYFSLFASADLRSGGIDSTIQATNQLYVTVNGALTRDTRLDSVSLPTVLFTPDITYGYRATETGNVYETIYSVARLSNFFGEDGAAPAAHTLLPNKPRDMTGSLPAPSLPGLYTATIGYRTDGGVPVTVDKPVLYLPVWGIAIGLAALLVLLRVVAVVRRRYRRRRSLR